MYYERLFNASPMEKRAGDSYEQSTGASLASAASPFLLPAASNKYVEKAVGDTHSINNVTEADRLLSRKLHDYWTSSGGKFTDLDNVVDHAKGVLGNDPGKIRKFGLDNPDSKTLNAMRLVEMGGPNYEAHTHQIYMPGHGRDLPSLFSPFGPHMPPGALAHEIGHGMSLKGNPNSTRYKLQLLSRMGYIPGGVIGGAVAGLGSPWMDDSTLGTIALGANAAGLPALAEETRASLNGYKLLRKLGGGRAKALGAFAGLPTYLLPGAMAAMPWVSRKIDRAAQS